MCRLREENPVKRSSRPVCNLSQPINQRLNAYALAAGAAGVGMLALAHPAEAKIVYTSAHIPIVQDGGPVELDLNHDGINDFQFSNAYTTERMRPPEGYHQSSLNVYPAQASNRVRAAVIKGQTGAAALPAGKYVGPHSPFEPGQSELNMWACAGGTSGGGCGGPWLKKKQAYLGLEFVIKGEIHFGWAHVQLAGESSPTIIGYAYETIPNRPIITGQTKGTNETNLKVPEAALTVPARQPASLGLLALGSRGLPIWRRKDESATAS
jgi:hypothetical protein